MSMSGSGRSRVSKWDSKAEEIQQFSGDDYTGKSGSYFREKDPENARFYPDGNGRSGSRRRSGPDDDDEPLNSRQHSGEAWPTRSRVSHDDGDDMMGYYDPRKSSEQDESRKQYFRQSPSRDRSRTRRSGSISNSRSRSRSRSPLQRVRRDGGGSYDRHKTRTRGSPRSGREVDGRYSRDSDYDWDSKNRKTRDTKYYTEDPREQHSARAVGWSDFPEDSNNSRRETSDSFLRSHRNESGRDRETQRRDIPEGEFHRSSNVPCKFFASGYCRNGNSCRFSHHGARSPERKPQDEMYSRHDNNNNNNHSGTTERMRSSHRWNDVERSDTGKSSEVEIPRVSSKVSSEAKGNNGSWIDNMEMSPDWNYAVKSLKKPVSEEHGVISQSSQSRVHKDAYEHGAAAIPQQDGKFSTVGEKTVASSHHNLGNNLINLAPPVQVFNQSVENQSTVPYQSTPLPVAGGSQVLLPAATNLPADLNPGNPGNGIAQTELLSSLVQFFGNGQQIPHLPSTLNPNSHTQSELLGNDSVNSGGVTALHTNSVDAQQVQIPDKLVSLDGNPKAPSEENREKKTEEKATKEPSKRKTGEKNEDASKDAENVVVEEEEDDDGAGDEDNKKGKDPKGMRLFKFALVEIVKELLKPAWKDGGMNKDAYKNIVKKVVDKVTGAIQTANIPQTQEKIDQYLSASKPKLTKLVQAYISKVKKS